MEFEKPVPGVKFPARGVLDMDIRLKRLLIIIAVSISLPIVTIFIARLCLADVMSLLSHGDFFYLNWRVFPILSSLPFIVYMEVVFISGFFTRDHIAHPGITKHMTTMTFVSCVLFFSSVLIGPALNIGLAFSSWHSCPVDGGFSGVYYVKDKSKCAILTSAVPWGDGK